MRIDLVNCLWHKTKKAWMWSGHIHLGEYIVTAGFCSEKCLNKSYEKTSCAGCYGSREEALVRDARMR